MAGERMARMPKEECGIHCSQKKFFPLLYYEEYEGAETVYDYHYYQMMLRVNNFCIQT
jgi:hypothetical protein